MLKAPLRRLRRHYRAILGRDFFARADVQCASERLGSQYATWTIASGRLTPESVVYSVGVGEDISFDLDLIERYGVTLHAFDPTPKSIEWLARQRLPVGFVAHGYGLADFDGDVEFHPPLNPNHVSHSLLGEAGCAESKAIKLPVKRLATIMSDLSHERIDLLKMDIEGAEYQVIDDLCSSDIRPEQILVEFHHRFATVGIGKTKNAIANLRAAGYGIFHISDNGEEYSMVRE